MERVATDVAKPPIPGGELPGFEELLAKGSFHARMAQARVEREKALAESGESEESILKTGRKPWERDGVGDWDDDQLIAAIANAATMQAAAPAIAPRPATGEPAPGTASARFAPTGLRGDSRTRAPSTSGQVSGGASANPAPGAAEEMPEQSLTIPPMACPSGAAAVRPSGTRRRRMMAGAGFLTGLAIGAAATMTLPRLVVPAPAAPEIGPGTVAVATTALAALPEVAQHPDTVLPAIESAVHAGTALPSLEVSAMSDPAPFGASPSPGMAGPAPLALTQSVVSDGAGTARPLVPAPVRGFAPPVPTVHGIPSPEAPDAALPVRIATARPFAPAGADGLDGAGLTAPVAGAAPAAVPRPEARPAVLSVGGLATAAATDAAVSAPEAPVPAAGPRFAGPVVLNAPESVGKAELAALLERLGAGGFVLAEPNRVDLRIKSSNVRFFHPEDAAAAESVAAQLGARVRDFTSFSPAPPAGTIEVWLAGQGNAAATAPAKPRRATAQPTMTAEERELNTLRNRILQQLRNGEYL